jgi:hypothetical protein
MCGDNEPVIFNTGTFNVGAKKIDKQIKFDVNLT